MYGIRYVHETGLNLLNAWFWSQFMPGVVKSTVLAFPSAFRPLKTKNKLSLESSPIWMSIAMAETQNMFYEAVNVWFRFTDCGHQLGPIYGPMWALGPKPVLGPRPLLRDTWGTKGTCINEPRIIHHYVKRFPTYLLGYELIANRRHGMCKTLRVMRNVCLWLCWLHSLQVKVRLWPWSRRQSLSVPRPYNSHCNCGPMEGTI